MADHDCDLTEAKPSIAAVELTRKKFDNPQAEPEAGTRTMMLSHLTPNPIPTSYAKKKQKRAPTTWIGEFAPSFRDELSAYAARVTKPEKRVFSKNPADLVKVRKMRPATVKTRLLMLRRGAVLYSQVYGVPLTEVTSLGMLIAPGIPVTLVKAYVKHVGEDAPCVRLLAVAFLYMARAMYPEDKEADARLYALLRHTAAAPRELTERNSEMLRAITRGHMRLLTALPQMIMDGLEKSFAARGKLTMFEVAAGMLAAAIAILLFAPLRIFNLSKLRLDESIHLTPEGGRITIPGSQTKNNTPLNQPIPAKSAVLLLRYMDLVLPWAENRTDMKAIFPGKGGFRNPAHFGVLITRGLLKWIGIPLNPHLFRHIAASQVLSIDPKDYEGVRAILGQRDSETARKFYLPLQNEGLLQHLMACMEGLNNETAPRA